MNQLTNPEAEQTVVGALIRRPSEDTINALKPADFSTPALGAAFAEIAAAYRRGETISVVALADTVGKKHQGADANYFRQLATEAPLDASAEARLVADYSIRRAVWAVGEQAQRLALNGADIATVQAALQDVVDEARQQASMSDTLVSVWDAQQELLHWINVEAQKPFDQRRQMLVSGLTEWDRLLDPALLVGDKIVIGGSPGTRKTSIAYRIAETNALANRGSMFVAVEMLPRHFAARGMSKETGLSARRIMSGWLPSDDLTKVNKTPPEPNLILVNHTRSISDVMAGFWRARSRLERAGSDLGLVVIDYIQRLGMAGRWGSKKEEIDAILDQLYKLSDYCPVIIISQLNRESREFEEPSIREAAASSALEYDATMFFLLWPDRSRPDIHWRLGKARDGERGPGGMILVDGPDITGATRL